MNKNESQGRIIYRTDRWHQESMFSQIIPSINFIVYRVPATFQYRTLLREENISGITVLDLYGFTYKGNGMKYTHRRPMCKWAHVSDTAASEEAHPAHLRCSGSLRRHRRNTLINTFEECINQHCHDGWHAALFSHAC